MQLSRNRIYLIVIAILVIIILLLSKCNGDKSNLIDSLTEQTNLLNQKYERETKFWKDKYGNEHVTSQRYRLASEHLTEQVKEQAKLLKIKPKQIQSTTTITIQTEIEKPIESKPIYVYVTDSNGDSTKRLHSSNFHYQDDWCQIDGIVCIDTVNCTSQIDISLNDTLVKTDYYKKTGLLGLGPKKHFVDLTNKNPYIQLTGITQLELANKEPKILIAPFLGLGYGSNNVIDRNPYPSATIGVAIVPYRFSIKIR